MADGYTTKFVMHDQYNTRPTVSFPAAEYTALWTIPNYAAWLQSHECE